MNTLSQVPWPGLSQPPDPVKRRTFPIGITGTRPVMTTEVNFPTPEFSYPQDRSTNAVVDLMRSIANLDVTFLSGIALTSCL
jgi:hypothetical protein